MAQAREDISRAVESAFTQLDKNKDDAVSRDELQVLLERIFGSQFPSSYLDMIMESGDANSSGTIDSLEELIDALQSVKAIIICCRMIAVLDIDKDGHLTREELQSKLETCNYDQVKDIIENAPVDETGDISCEDFFGYCFQRMQ